MIIKVCGMRHPQNIAAVEQLPVQWMGFIFYAPSSRYVATPPSYLPTQQKRVGVFVNEERAILLERAAQYGLHAIQLHGAESVALCHELREEGYTVIKAIPLATAADLAQATRYEGAVDYLLFDTKTPLYGGSGCRFNWEMLSAYQGTTPFLLSGGITPQMATALAQFHHPQWAGIDLNSGFEIAPAVKDAAQLAQFITQLNTLNHANQE